MFASQSRKPSLKHEPQAGFSSAPVVYDAIFTSDHNVGFCGQTPPLIKPPPVGSGTQQSAVSPVRNELPAPAPIRSRGCPDSDISGMNLIKHSGDLPRGVTAKKPIDALSYSP